MIVSGLSPSLSSYANVQSRGSAASAAKDTSSSKAENAAQLSPEEKAQVEKLKARDREVRQHEQAHLAASGGLATSGANYTYQRGPDGVNYAVGGEVSINVSPGRTPEETLRRAQTIRAAALAPSDPSGADRAVAASAAKLEQEALAELAAQQREQSSGMQQGSGQQVGGTNDPRIGVYRQANASTAREPVINTYA